MARLVVNPGTEAAWEIELLPGVNTFGRSSDNRFPIEHESVSTCHCEITVARGRVVLKDLGSVNGTYLENELVETALLRPGQRLRLGDVEMLFDPPASGIEDPSASRPEVRIPVPRPVSDSSGLVVSPVAARVATAGGGLFCKFHPRVRARFLCEKCDQAVCELCVSTREGAAAGRKFCRTCGSPCTPVPEAASAATATRPPPFGQQVAHAFSYPLAGDGLILLVSGTIFYSLLWAVASFAKYGLIYGLMAFLFIAVFGSGYLISYLRRIVTGSAMGEDTMPDWPDFSDMTTDILVPFLQFVATVLICFLPVIPLLFLDRKEAWMNWAIDGAMVYGCFCLPMAFLAVSMFDSLTALNPLLIMPSIMKVPLAYLVTVAIFAAVIAVRWAGNWALAQALPGLLAAVLSNFLGLYLVIIGVRVLGLLYRSHRARLGWFKK